MESKEDLDVILKNANSLLATINEKSGEASMREINTIITEKATCSNVLEVREKAVQLFNDLERAISDNASSDVFKNIFIRTDEVMHEFGPQVYSALEQRLSVIEKGIAAGVDSLSFASAKTGIHDFRRGITGDLGLFDAGQRYVKNS